MKERDNVTGRKRSTQRLINLFPKGLRLRLNPDRYCIEKFVEKISKQVTGDSKILDAGAGPCPYKELFKHCKYEATDVEKFSKDIDFTCSLDNIPKKDRSYDAILSTEVLEHVEYPWKVSKEFYRVLKRGGKLYLTVPQGRLLHQEPYNFYYYTKYGLKSLLKDAGFKEIKITSKGGYFWFLADVIRFNGLLEPLRKYKLLYYPLRFLEYPLTNILMPFILFHLDSLDRVQKWTIGYAVEARKD